MTQPPTGTSDGRPAPYGRPGSRPAPYGGAAPQGAPGQYDSAGYGRVGGGRSNDGRPNCQQPSPPPVRIPVIAPQGIPAARTFTPPVHRPERASAVPVTDRLVRRTAATGSGWIVLVLCGAVGLLLLAFGLKTIVGGGDDSTFGLTMLITGLILLVPVPMMMSMRTEFDSSGIHTRVLGFRRDIPWPRSRSDLFVKRPQCAPAAGDSPGARPHRPGPPHRGRRGCCRREPERPSLRQGPSRASRLVAGADSSRSVAVHDGAPGRCRSGPHLDLGSGPRLHPGDGYARAIVG